MHPTSSWQGPEEGAPRAVKDDLSPRRVPNWIDGAERPPSSEQWFDKLSPVTGKIISQAARSNEVDVSVAVAAAVRSQMKWAVVPPVQRGMALHQVVDGMQAQQDEIARVVAAETGKSHKEAFAETAGAVALGLFYASEGQRLYGRTTTSGQPNRYAMTVRVPIGVAGLIVPANTPIANVAWKVFPALVCGNAVVLKAAEDAPATAWLFARIAHEAGLPAGILNVLQGYGEEAGAPLVQSPFVGVISFTGSTNVGRWIQREAADRLARVSLELGGKNPFVVCDDADLEKAATWAVLSVFSNAGQRCSSGSRIIVFDTVYEQFRALLLGRVARLKLGPGDDDDFGPVINEQQLNGMLAAVSKAKGEGAVILCGGQRLLDVAHRDGYYMAPTLIENADAEAEISHSELFGPIGILYRAKDFNHALRLANASPYGLTACIHTRSIDRAVQFCEKVEAGVAVVNAGTYGSEPHMPFGGMKQSGNGTREPGTEAIDVYTELKDIYINIDPIHL